MPLLSIITGSGVPVRHHQSAMRPFHHADEASYLYGNYTRKERVTIVGEKALCISIKRTDTEKRGTCLAKRLQALA